MAPFGRLIVVLLFIAAGAAAAADAPRSWKREWPATDFSKASVDLDEIRSGGVPRDAIPSIDRPRFAPVGKVEHLADEEPVISLTVAGEARAYPLQVMIWHEIVNDVVGGVPVAVTFCPLCNASVVFERTVGGDVLEFGTTGKLRHSDLVMYDRQTMSWWQQFTGTAIVGEMTDRRLRVLPARIESFERFRERAPEGHVLVPNNPGARRYGLNPYEGYDSNPYPFLYQGKMPKGIAPLARVVSVDGAAWSLRLVQKRGKLDIGNGVTISWSPGQTSALDDAIIARGIDVGNVVVQRQTPEGPVDVPYGIDFAFAFHAFHPDAPIHTK